MNKYYITFGSQSIFRDYYVIAVSDSIDKVTTLANEQFKNVSMIYKEDEFISSFFPKGILVTIDVLKNRIVVLL